MAKRKSRKAKARYFTKKTYRKSRNGSSSLLMTMLSAGIYGAIRSKAATYITPYTNKLPLGNISDEAGMIGLAYIGNKFLGNRIPLVKGICKAGMMIEGARIGEAVATGTTGLSGLGNGSMTSTNVQGAGMNVYS